jgi:hypothetical protein
MGTGRNNGERREAQCNKVERAHGVAPVAALSAVEDRGVARVAPNGTPAMRCFNLQISLLSAAQMRHLVCAAPERSGVRPALVSI